jgi:oligoendopeptidase F
MLTGNLAVEEDAYFQFENVLSYWGRSFAALGIHFNGGRVSLDLLDRKGKHNNGFCHYPDLVHYKNGKRIPGSSNFASNAVPGQVGSGIEGIHTVFHEGGHAADRLNSMQQETCVNTEYPPSSVSWAETHSMFMDTISSSIEWRMRYAKNAEGRSYPFELFLKKLDAVYPLYPLDMMHVSFIVTFEKEIYETKNLTTEKVISIAKKAFKKHYDRSEDSIWALNVSHIYSWESSGYYHGYGLAELGVCQWREYFFKKYGYIVDNPKVGKEITKMWSYASLYPTKKLVEMATGKKLSPDAFIRSVTKSKAKVIADAKDRIERLKKVPLYTKPVDLNGKIIMVHGKKKIADNSKSFEDMDKKYRAWLKTVK